MADPAASPATTRQLGLAMCTALVVGNTIGMGIFMQPAALAPYGINALTGWAAVMIGCASLAIVFAALARKLSHAHGPFDYVRTTLGEPVAFAALWCYWISTVVTNAALAVAVVAYVTSVFPAARGTAPATLTVAFIWSFVAVNLLGVKSGGRVQVITSVVKMIPLVVVIIAGGAAILFEPSTYLANLPTTPPVRIQPSMTAAIIALYAMLGFESAAIAAGRVRDPETTIPRATFIGTLLVAIVYIAIVAIGMLLVPQAALAASDAPFLTIVDTLLGPGAARWLALFVVISGLGALNGWTLLVGEQARTLATRKLMPEMMGWSNRFGAPWLALFVTGALATFIALMNYSESLVTGFTFLSVVVTAANLPLYFCCALALLAIGRRNSAALTPMLWLAASGGMAFTAFAFVGVGRAPFLWSLALGLAGLPYYFWMRWRHPAQPIAAQAS